MGNSERGTGAHDQEKVTHVLLECGSVKIMSDGSIIEGKENNEERNAKSWDAYLATLPAEEAADIREHARDRDQRLAEFRKEYPIGSQIDMGVYLEKTFGSLETVQKVNEVNENDADLLQALEKLKKQERQGKDVKQAIKQNFIACLENEIKIKKLLKVEGIYDGGLSIGSDALKVLKTHPDGKILYSFDGEEGRPGDSSRTEFVTKHGNDVLHYEAVCHEFGTGTYYSVNSARDYIRREEEESITEKADLETLEKLEK